MTTMNCEEFVDLVTAYLDEELDAGTRRRFTGHIGVCGGCDVYLRQIRVTVAEVGRLPARNLTDRSRENLLEAFRDWSAR
ncbi:anti-sigma factor family protein [Planotetraspora kaengkrachanensis]|uniref:Anti-sigma factor n=1 Tax=Planotetraspora kaengkrachanensis TaxID=575193 RepID=A0A8J3M2N5_9ACTN|nr:zf-HC2 domain-containing protein [Planotetraspora kaengkrachanensis]GIG77916.1 anti-sigma factor [Planotetraspora kaengkrachanensis]